MTESLLTPGTLLAGQRTEYRLGDRLAEGGEGIVYRILGRPELVAKICREFDFSREAKLTHLVSEGTKRLHRVSAWPLSVLKDPEDRAVGFVMQHLDRWQPLHSVYQTKIRLQNHPNRTYSFLVRTARNLATCVHHVHEAGFVIGDLNESNVLVDDQAMAKLIDTDSFQVTIDGHSYPCKVGKYELLPPELQGRSLDGVERTENHDRFGLAILLFQTLVFGRHPFSGRPKDNKERTLEECIANGYYAFTRRRETPVDPPPYITLDWLPESIRELFEQAFDPMVAERPAPHDWYLALKQFESELVECRDSASHRYWGGAGKCPWCHLEERWGLALFRSGVDFGSLDIDADALWNSIAPLQRQIVAHEDLKFIDHKQVQSANLGMKDKVLLRLMKPGFPMFWLYFVFFKQVREGAFLLVIVLCLITMMLLSPTILMGSLRRRVGKAEKRLGELKAQYEAEASQQRIQRRFEELQSMRDTLRNFNGHVQTTREALIRKKHQGSLEAFLRKYSVLGADIGPVGREKLTMLHDSGYVTAEDVTEQKLRHQRAKNPELVKHLIAWRASLEVQFWATSEYTLAPFEEQKMMANLRREASDMRQALQNAPQELLELQASVDTLHEEISAKAQADLDVVRSHGGRLLAYELALDNKRR